MLFRITVHPRLCHAVPFRKTLHPEPVDVRPGPAPMEPKPAVSEIDEPLIFHLLRHQPLHQLLCLGLGEYGLEAEVFGFARRGQALPVSGGGSHSGDSLANSRASKNETNGSTTA